MKADCAFCQIVAGTIPTPILFEDEHSAAFLDHRPLFPGHTLLVPKQHLETLADVPPEMLGPFFRNAQLLAKAVESAMEAQGSFVAINNRVSQSVPHLHVHVVPRRRKDGLKGFFWPRNSYPSEEAMRETHRAIRQAIDALR